MVKSTRQRAHPQGTNARNRQVGRPAWNPVRDAAPDLSRDARRRLDMLDWHRAHGANVSRSELRDAEVDDGASRSSMPPARASVAPRAWR